MRALFLLALSALATAAALAQNPKENTSQPAPDKGEQLSQQEAADSDKGQRIERIVVEDAGSRIDELRVGGQTQSITVHPKADVPSYNVQPANPSHPDGRDGAGRRTWNVLSF